MLYLCRKHRLGRNSDRTAARSCSYDYSSLPDSLAFPLFSCSRARGGKLQKRAEPDDMGLAEPFGDILFDCACIMHPPEKKRRGYRCGNILRSQDFRGHTPSSPRNSSPCFFFASASMINTPSRVVTSISLNNNCISLPNPQKAMFPPSSIINFTFCPDTGHGIFFTKRNPVRLLTIRTSKYGGKE